MNINLYLRGQEIHGNLFLFFSCEGNGVYPYTEHNRVALGSANFTNPPRGPAQIQAFTEQPCSIRAVLSPIYLEITASRVAWIDKRASHCFTFPWEILKVQCEKVAHPSKPHPKPLPGIRFILNTVGLVANQKNKSHGGNIHDTT